MKNRAVPKPAVTRALPMACLLGDIDMLVPLARAGIPTALVAERDDPARHSRLARGFIPRLDHWTEQEAFVERLLAWASQQSDRPVLFFQTDGDLLLVSRHREALQSRFGFVIAEHEIIEKLLDKARFYELAVDLGLHAPATRSVRADDGLADAGGLRFPLLVKWARRGPTQWIDPGAKAVKVSAQTELEQVWERLAESRLDVVVQELIEGPESRIESYHAYIDGDGEVVADFTGAKIRTYPVHFGYTTALEITDADDVRKEGRNVVARLDLRGVVKVDFKRDGAGQLWLLEVNPRFNLWHHAGALAGVNLPALVYADVTGTPRPATQRARAGITWCEPFEDRWAAEEQGLSLAAWAKWVLHTDARSGADWSDLKPLVLGSLWPRARRKIRERQRALARGVRTFGWHR